MATGIGYYFAKGENEKRWKDQRARGLRSPEHQDCEWTRSCLALPALPAPR